MFELPQLTENAETAEGAALIEENERYNQLINGTFRKTVDAETQTPQVYTKTRGTYLGREERRNRATFVNNWVMHDTFEKEGSEGDAGHSYEESRFKFAETSTEDPERRGQPHDQLDALGKQEAYQDATRVTLRILASKSFEEAQKRFTGLLRQDPCDPHLELVYGLELLWRHEAPTPPRPVTSFRWNPANQSVLAVGYDAVKHQGSEEFPGGLVLIWCAKNPTVPDRTYEFASPVSDLDWSKTRTNLLAIGFYDGVVRVIDVSKKDLTVIRQSRRKTSPSFEPHWQICIWDIRRKTHRPASTTQISAAGVRVVRLEFTRSGEQIVAADEAGTVHVYGLVGSPLPAYDPGRSLVNAVRKALVTKPELLHRLEKLGRPFA